MRRGRYLCLPKSIAHSRQCLQVVLRALILCRVLLRELLVQRLRYLCEVLMVRLDRITQLIHPLILHRIFCSETAVQAIANVSEVLLIFVGCCANLSELLILSSVLLAKLGGQPFDLFEHLPAIDLGACVLRLAGFHELVIQSSTNRCEVLTLILESRLVGFASCGELRVYGLEYTREVPVMLL